MKGTEIKPGNRGKIFEPKSVKSVTISLRRVATEHFEPKMTKICQIYPIWANFVILAQSAPELRSAGW